MLELKNITKDYKVGDGVVHALRGVTLQFRKSEFVSILGPSGCGKTTMLNIVGGLDQYTEGDLIINGRSTKDFKDRDWDAYRNHSIGFVFQSYNLIPHQNVLQNVELALTLSGVSKSQRRERAKKALEDVGLGNQLKKKPSELSGGQMQRVAIARALVNNPDIILADEPTGALDTETSVQVMEILKNISKDRLVVMVTHNPELAEKYSTRIIRMIDGIITDDSKPLSDDEITEYQKENAVIKTEKSVREKKPSMSIFTAFGLSLKNLFSKKGRTVLTSFSGSIGIIGIALIFSVSQGLSSYIDAVQEDTLSSYPLTITETHTDMNSLLEAFMGSVTNRQEHENNAIYVNPIIYDLLNALSATSENDLEAFKKHIEKECAANDGESTLKDALTGIRYTYDTDLLVYTKNVDGKIIHSDMQELLQSMIMKYATSDPSIMDNVSGMGDSSSSSNMMSMMSPAANMGLWQEMLSGEDGELINPLIKKQYDLIEGGKWPSAYNEVLLVVDDNNELDDITLYALGLKSEKDINAILDAAINSTKLDADTQSWSYEDIIGMEFRVILNSECYSYNESTGLYTDLRENEASLEYLYENGTVLKVTGILRPNEDAVAGMITGAVAYTSKLTEYIIEKSNESDAIKAQLENPKTDILTGLPFGENSSDFTNEQKADEFKNYISDLNTEEKAKVYIDIMSIIPDAELSAYVQQAVSAMPEETKRSMLIQGAIKQYGISEADAKEYIEKLSVEVIDQQISAAVAEMKKAEYAAIKQMELSAISTEERASLLDSAIQNNVYSTEQYAKYYDEVLIFSNSSYEKNLSLLGYVDINKPSSINLYASSFESKDAIEASIAEYNDGVSELSKIKYTDYIGLMMSSITTIINAITYVLIAFVSISLVVSSIMIGVITLISVQERTKEIGILRAIGASKRNVSSMFNAETVIIGFMAGVLGVGVTYLFCLPINFIIQSLTGLPGLKAYMPFPIGIVLVIISVLLTLISGFIPSRSAAKKDPVVALRSE